MTCHPLGNGGGFFCTRGPQARCSSCNKRLASKLCDFDLTGAKAGSTCDRKLCAGCAVVVGPERDYCPAHARASTALAVRAVTTLAKR
jgi:hypothetical protein